MLCIGEVVRRNVTVQRQDLFVDAVDDGVRIREEGLFKLVSRSDPVARTESDCRSIEVIECEFVDVGCHFLHYRAAFAGIAEWYTERRVFGKSGYPWAAPEYKGDRSKLYTLADVPNADKALNDTIMIYPLESWSETNIQQVSDAFHKVYEAYRVE